MGRHRSIVWDVELSNNKKINMKYTTAQWLTQQPACYGEKYGGEVQ
jgi:hypothetical protein